MNNRMNVCAPRPKKDGGTYWHKVGAAFPSKNGDGWNIILDSLPLPDKEGRCALSLFPIREDERGGGQRQQGGGGGFGAGADMDDSIPFSPEWRI